jgi:hypothetical protein
MDDATRRDNARVLGNIMLPAFGDDALRSQKLQVMQVGSCDLNILVE